MEQSILQHAAMAVSEMIQISCELTRKLFKVYMPHTKGRSDLD